MKNKYLLIIFVVLLAIYAGVSLFGDKKDSSFKDEIVRFETDAGDKIKIFPKDKSQKDFSIIKNEGIWTIKTGDKEYKADKTIVENVLNSLNNLKVENIVTKNPEKWSKYELEDEKSKRVQIFSGKKKLTDLLIGKFKFNPQTRSASSYVRLAGEKEVYSTKGYGGINISDNISSYRIKDLVKLTPQDVQNIKYFHKGNILELNKSGKDWVYGNIVIDSAKIASYLSSLSNMKGTKFVDAYENRQKPAATDSLNIELGTGNINITAYPDTIISKGFVIHSSLNDEAYFESDSAGLYKRIFGKILNLVER